MKNLKFLFLLMALLIANIGGFAFNAVEKAAQKEVKDYLERQGFKTEIDNDDNSVMFKQSDILYWVTFKALSDANGILYTLHRRPVKLPELKDGVVKANLNHEIAVYAVNELNEKFPYKAYVRGQRVNFEFPVYASSPQEYVKQLNNVLKSLRNAQNDFDAAARLSKATVDSIHNYWADNDTARVILPGGDRLGNIKTRSELKVGKVAIGSVDNRGDFIVDYDGFLTTRNCEFLMEKVAVSASVPGEYQLGVKILNPDKKMIASAGNKEFTTELNLLIKKANKEQEVVFPPFGTTSPDFWQPGIYTIQIYDANVLVREDVFNISSGQ